MNKCVSRVAPKIFRTRTKNTRELHNVVDNPTTKPDKHKTRTLLDEFAKSFNIHLQEDWYQIKPSDIKNTEIKTLISSFSNSLSTALEHAYPEYIWMHWRSFFSVPKRFWDDTSNHRRYFDWIAEQLEIETQHEWYALKYESIAHLKASTLIFNYYNGSLSNAIMSVYKEKTWYPWMFTYVPNGYWASVSNQRKYLDWLAGEMNFTEHEHWYRLTREDVINRRGIGLLERYEHSVPNMLVNVYPELPWQLFKFKSAPQRFWNDERHQKEYFDWLTETLDIKQIDDWNAVTIDLLHEKRAYSLLRRHGNSLHQMLADLYPEVRWDRVRVRGNGRGTGTQLTLLKTIKDIFPYLHYKGNNHMANNNNEFCGRNV